MGQGATPQRQEDRGGPSSDERSEESVRALARARSRRPPPSSLPQAVIAAAIANLPRFAVLRMRHQRVWKALVSQG